MKASTCVEYITSREGGTPECQKVMRYIPYMLEKQSWKEDRTLHLWTI